jgi:hypothetical protein
MYGLWLHLLCTKLLVSFFFREPVGDLRVFLLRSKKFIVLQTMMATPPLRRARHTLPSTKHYVTSPSDPPLRLQPSHSPHSCTTRLTTAAAGECTLSNTRALRSSHNDRRASMMRELARLLSSLERCSTAAGHHSSKVLCASGKGMASPSRCQVPDHTTVA